MAGQLEDFAARGVAAQQAVDFETALERFRAGLAASIRDRMPHGHPMATPLMVELMRGPKYIRVVIVGENGGARSRSAWGFVEVATGAILASDGWRRPAKHARGSIYAPDPLAGCGRSGPARLRGWGLVVAGLLLGATVAHAQGGVTLTACSLFDRDGGIVYPAAGRLTPGHAVCAGRITAGPRATLTSATTGWAYDCDGTLPSVWVETIDSQGHASLVCQR